MKLISTGLATLACISLFAQTPTHLASVNKDGKWGFVDQNCEEAITPKYQRVKSFKNNYSLVLFKDKWGVIDASGNEIIEPKYETIQNSGEGMFAVRINEKWGVLDANGELVIDSKYNKVKEFKNNYALALTNENKWCLLSKEGTEVFPKGLKDYKISALNEGIALILNTSEGKFGYMDLTGNWIIEPTYVKAKAFYNGRAAYLENEKWGYLNTSGEKVIKAQYVKVSKFNENIAQVSNGNTWSYIDVNGNKLGQGGYIKAQSFNDGHAIIRDHTKKVGVINPDGSIAIKPEWDKIERIDSKSYVAVLKGKKWGFVDYKGNVVIEPQYDQVDVFRNGLAAVLIKKKWGFINEQNEIVIEPKYLITSNNNVSAFTKYAKPKDGFVLPNIARVKLDKKWTFINKEGELVCPLYNNAERFVEIKK